MSFNGKSPNMTRPNTNDANINNHSLTDLFWASALRPMFRVTTGRAQRQKIGSQTSKSFAVSELDIILYNHVRAQLAGVMLILGFAISWGGFQDI